MSLTFITGNKNKFEEFALVLGPNILKQLNIDLPEIQELDAREVIKAKLIAAEEYATGEYLVEDTSLYLSCLQKKLPGPFIKWFEQSLGIDGIAHMAEQMNDTKAEAVTLIGYINSQREINFFEGRLSGTIISKRGDKDFGWGPIFVPDGHTKTFGEMEKREKNEISMRGKALQLLKQYIESRHI